VIRATIPNTACSLNSGLCHNFHRHLTTLLFRLFRLLEFSLLDLGIIENLLLNSTGLFLGLLGVLLGLFSLRLVLFNFDLIGVSIAHGIDECLGTFQCGLVKFVVNYLLDLHYKIAGLLLGDFKANFVVFLIELVDLDLAFAFGLRIADFVGLEIDLHLETVQEDLLLLPNGYRCVAFNAFHLIKAYFSIVLGHCQFAYLGCQVLFGELGEVFLLIEPRVVIPD